MEATRKEKKEKLVTPGTPRLALNETDAAFSLGVQPRTMQEWRREGGGPPYVRISGRCVRYMVRDLESWAAERLKSNTGE